MRKILITCFISLLFIKMTAQQKKWSLSEIIEYAKSNNLELKAKKFENRIIKNEIKYAKRQKLPSVSASFGNSIIMGLESIPITNSNQQVTGVTNGYKLYQNNFNIGASIMLFNKGKLKHAEEKAKIDYKVAELSMEAKENTIIINIIKLYLSVLLNKELSSVSKEKLEAVKLQLQRNEILYEDGAIPISQLYEVQSLVSKEELNVKNSIISISESKFNLSQLLMIDDYSDFELEEVSLDDIVPIAFKDGVVLDEILEYALKENPSIKLVELKKESNQKEIEILKTKYWPTLNLAYNFVTDYRNYLNKGISSVPIGVQWWNNQNHIISINISIPVFNSFLTDLEVENSKINLLATENNIEIEKQKLKQEIQSLYFLTKSSYEKYLASEITLNLMRKNYELAKISLDAGKITIYDYNYIYSEYFEMMSEFIQSKYDYIFKLKLLDFYKGSYICCD